MAENTDDFTDDLSDDLDDGLDDGLDDSVADTVQDGSGDADDGPGDEPSLEQTDDLDSDRNLNLILDIPLAVTVELGRTKMLINDLLQLSQGSVIELTKLVGEPLEILVNNKLVARGEVVVVNEKFGVRLTDIVSPLERVQSLS